MTKPIVVGYDGSEVSDMALAWAAAESRERGLPLHVLVAWSAPPMGFTAASDAELDAELIDSTRSAGATAVDRAVRRASDLGARSPDGELVEGAAARALLDASHDASIVVTGSHGRGGFMGMLLGSVSRQVSTHAVCPAVIVRTPADPDATEVVVGIDGSEHSDLALAFAFEFADRHGYSLRVLHSWDVPPVGAITGVPTFSAPKLIEDLQNTEIRTIAEALAGHRERFPSVVVTQDIQRGSPIKALNEASQHAAAVVIGSRGRGGFLGLLLGSVSHSVAHHASCTVAIVR